MYERRCMAERGDMMLKTSGAKEFMWVLHSDVQHGHCVRFPDGSFVTSLHLKDQLVDADGLGGLGSQGD